MISRTNKNNISFKGILYCNFYSHISKGISCCPNGDAKFIKTFNKIVRKNPSDLKINFAEDNTKKIIVETTQTPHLNFFETLFYIVNPVQKKALKLKKEGKITSFIYQLSELEFKNIKENYIFIRKKTLKEFEQNIKNLVSKNNTRFLKEYFNQN